MDWILSWMNSTMFTVLGQSITVVEVIGFVTGALCVWAVTREYIWNWPIGILNNMAFVVLFLGAGLYADTILQVVFAAIGVYGWIVWTRGRRTGDTIRVLRIRRATRREMLVGLSVAALATAGVAYLLASETNSEVPWPDAFILAASLLATWGQANKILEQWWVWIVVDIVSIPLYAAKGLWLTAILYVGFLALCIYGVRRWNREFRGRSAVSAAPASEQLAGARS